MYSIWAGYFIWFQFSASVQGQESRPIKWFCQTTILIGVQCLDWRDFIALTFDMLCQPPFQKHVDEHSPSLATDVPPFFLFNCLMFFSANRLMILKWLHSCAELPLIKISFHLIFAHRKDQLNVGFIMRHKIILCTHLNSITSCDYVSLVTLKGIRKWQAAQLHLQIDSFQYSFLRGEILSMQCHWGPVRYWQTLLKHKYFWVYWKKTKQKTKRLNNFLISSLQISSTVLLSTVYPPLQVTEGWSLF